MKKTLIDELIDAYLNSKDLDPEYWRKTWKTKRIRKEIWIINI